MSGNDKYGRRQLLRGDTAEIFGFTFNIQMRYLVSTRYLSVAQRSKLYSRPRTFDFSVVNSTAPTPVHVWKTAQVLNLVPQEKEKIDKGISPSHF